MLPFFVPNYLQGQRLGSQGILLCCSAAVGLSSLNSVRQKNKEGTDTTNEKLNETVLKQFRCIFNYELS